MPKDAPALKRGERYFLKRSRILKGYTLKQLADIIDVRMQRVDELERGIRNAGPKRWDRLESVLGVDKHVLRQRIGMECCAPDDVERRPGLEDELIRVSGGGECLTALLESMLEISS
jgi:transcriptional regulator with XRE-family HTH domain